MASIQSYKRITGTITTQNLTPTLAATPGSFIGTKNAGFNTMTIQVTGVWTGALTLQLSVDGVNWVTVGGVPIRNVTTGTTLINITSALAGVYQADITGSGFVRITALAAVTGTATVTLHLTDGNAMVALSQGLPAGANALGSVTISSAAGVTPTIPTNFTLTSAATTNATVVKALAGSIFAMTLTNYSALSKFVKFYAKATAPTVGTDIPTETIEIPANSCRIQGFAQGLPYLLGISIAITGLQPDTDTTAVAAGDVKVHLGYI